MKVVQVEYRRRLEVGARGMATFGGIAEVEGHETPESALDRLQRWVEGRIVEEDLASRIDLKLRDDLEAKKSELAVVEQRLALAEKRWRWAETFLRRHGLDPDGRENPFDPID